MPSSFVRTAVACCLVMFASHTATAQQPASFDRGRTIELIAGGSAGSDPDIYGRLVARYLGKHLADSPVVSVVDMPGDGGQVAAARVYSSAVKDGTVIGVVPADALAAPLWRDFGKRAYDPPKFLYLGSAAPESTDCFVSGDAPVQRLRDAFVREVTMGALIEGGPTRDGPVLLDALLGTRFRLVQKYVDVSNLLSAIEKGEVMGACGLTWSSVSTRHPHWLLKGALRGLVQESDSGSGLATRLGVPLAVDFAASAQDREVLTLAHAEQAFARPFVLPPGTPPALTVTLRKAFIETLQDHTLLAEAKAASLAIDPLSGQDVGKKVAALYGTPRQTIDGVRAALAEAERQ